MTVMSQLLYSFLALLLSLLCTLEYKSQKIGSNYLLEVASRGKKASVALSQGFDGWHHRGQRSALSVVTE